jgi:hypothetical protein
MTWLLHVLGVDNESSHWYAFWSGFGSDLGLFGAAAVFLRRHNCHTRRCWRMGRFPDQATGYVLCQKHHPIGALPKKDLRRVRP